MRVQDLDETPLRLATPPAWVGTALADLPAFLNDHAHLERKAASNALELLNRWPWPVDVHTRDERSTAAERWSRVLTSIAKDEVLHLGQVLRKLARHGGQFERAHVNPYAAALRRLVRMGDGLRELRDRLLVSALIEVRSLERFTLLAAYAPQEDLRRFYASLMASERGHYRSFLDLAELLPVESESVEERWALLLDEEGKIMSVQPRACRIHGGC